MRSGLLPRSAEPSPGVCARSTPRRPTRSRTRRCYPNGAAGMPGALPLPDPTPGPAPRTDGARGETLDSRARAVAAQVNAGVEASEGEASHHCERWGGSAVEPRGGGRRLHPLPCVALLPLALSGTWLKCGMHMARCASMKHPCSG